MFRTWSRRRSAGGGTIDGKGRKRTKAWLVGGSAGGGAGGSACRTSFLLIAFRKAGEMVNSGSCVVDFAPARRCCWPSSSPSYSSSSKLVIMILSFSGSYHVEVDIWTSSASGEGGSSTELDWSRGKVDPSGHSTFELCPAFSTTALHTPSSPTCVLDCCSGWWWC